MKLNLQNPARTEASFTLTLSERLPHQVHSPCTIHCTWDLEQVKNVYKLHLKLNAELTLICQRCLEPFTYLFEHENTLAMCKNEPTLERLMADYDCVHLTDTFLDFTDILTDELHLYAPEKHPIC